MLRLDEGLGLYLLITAIPICVVADIATVALLCHMKRAQTPNSVYRFLLGVFPIAARGRRKEYRRLGWEMAAGRMIPEAKTAARLYLSAGSVLFALWFVYSICLFLAWMHANPR